MAKIHITTKKVYFCSECPALMNHTKPKCLIFAGPREIDDIDKIPDWCPLEETE